MKQIAFKLPDEEIEFLDWYSKKTGTPKGSFYRQLTLNEFKKEKLKLLLNEYSSGSIGFKKMCNLGNISFSEGMLLLEKEQIEPPIPSIIDEYTEKVTTDNIEGQDYSIFKNGKKPIRKSKKIEFSDENLTQ